MQSVSPAKKHNVYVMMLRRALANIQSEMGRLNVVVSRNIDVKVSDVDAVLDIIRNITKHPASALRDYSKQVDKYIVVQVLEHGMPKQQDIHRRTAGAVFVESILRSVSARSAQLRLVGLFAAERFLHDAYSYDMRNQVTGSNTAMEQAKKSLLKILRPGSIVDFDFTQAGPVINSSVRNALENVAYDSRFSFMDRDTVQRISIKKYETVFVPEEKLFGHVVQGGPVLSSAVLPSSVQSSEVTASLLGLDHMYRGMFASLPVTGRRRRLVNLRSRNNDIMIAPVSSLHTKRQFARIEMMSKHSFIMDYYNDQMPDGLDGSGMAQYFFRQEDAMYRRIWGHQKSVHYSQGALHFPDGTVMHVPKNLTPHEFFHKVNTVYAALFGFTGTDTSGGSEWLYDSVRKAYTDEGQAGYRLELIDSVLGNKGVPGGFAV